MLLHNSFKVHAKMFVCVKKLLLVNVFVREVNFGSSQLPPPGEGLLLVISGDVPWLLIAKAVVEALQA